MVLVFPDVTEHRQVEHRERAAQVPAHFEMYYQPHDRWFEFDAFMEAQFTEISGRRSSLCL
jgi:hypothetical protein